MRLDIKIYASHMQSKHQKAVWNMQSSNEAPTKPYQNHGNTVKLSKRVYNVRQTKQANGPSHTLEIQKYASKKGVPRSTERKDSFSVICCSVGDVFFSDVF